MELKNINYEIFRIKYDLKYKVVFFFAGARLNAKNWLVVEQALKRLGLYCYKVYNIIARNVMENSTFKYSKFLINSITLFTFLSQENKIMLPKKLVSIHSQLVPMAFKINNKIYRYPQIKGVRSLNYKKYSYILCKLFRTTTKSKLIKTVFSK